MPTKPSQHKSKKHSNNYLDEAVAKSTYHKKPVTRNRAILAGLLGIPFGWIGIHNFLMRRKKRAFAHFTFSSIGFGMFFLPVCYGVAVIYQCRHTKECIDISSYDDTLNAIVITGIILFAISVLWGAIEGIILLINRNRFPVSTDAN
jgi:hypothetical protein